MAKEPEKIKVAMAFTVEVDVAQWKLEYGPNGTVREDVKSWYDNLIHQSAAGDGAAKVTKGILD